MFIFSSMYNQTWSKSLPNFTQNQHMSDKHSWLINHFTIVQRSFFILSLIVLFWIIFVIVYMLSRLILRLIANFKLSHLSYDSPSLSNEKICRAFVISPNHYGSFRPSPLVYRSDSLFSHIDFVFNSEQTVITTTASEQSLQRSSSTKTNNKTILEHYLQTYNPLKIDLTNINEGTVRTSIAKDIVYEQAPSDTDTRPIANCYALNCTNKQKFSHGGRYVRLKEQENCSATMSIADDRLSDCSTKLTRITLPTVMVTDCSDSQRLHTEIIELSEDENDQK